MTAGFESVAQISEMMLFLGWLAHRETVPLHTPSRSLRSVCNYLVLGDEDE